MRNIAIVLMGVAWSEGACAQSPAPAGGGEIVNVTQSNIIKAVDCKGRSLAVSGNDDTLEIRNCDVIDVLGSRDRLTAHLLRSSKIAVLGNHDHVVFEDEPGFDPQVTSSGTDDEIVPEMSDKDMTPNPWRPRK